MRSIIITDHTVEKLYGKKWQTHFKADLISFPAGEKYKTRKTKEILEDALLKEGYKKDTVLIALGGGVVTDMVGYLASTFCRGVDLILIPTTLVAMVDAAIGGKNGVNTSYGKNMIGTIYHPKQVIIDTSFLKTLPQKEIYNGQVEIMKLGLLFDPYLLTHLDILRAIELKRRVVALDETDQGKRRLLNLGHTIGHALEHLSSYTLLHGEAVALGIRIECDYAFRLGVLEEESWRVIQELFPKKKIPYTHKQLIETLFLDKKSKQGRPRFVLLKKIGQALSCEDEYCHFISDEILSEVLDDYVVHCYARCKS